MQVYSLFASVMYQRILSNTHTLLTYANIFIVKKSLKLYIYFTKSLLNTNFVTILHNVSEHSYTLRLNIKTHCRYVTNKVSYEATTNQLNINANLHIPTNPFNEYKEN